MDRRHLASAITAHNPHLLRAARWAYGSPSPLLTRSDAGKVENLLLSSQGVRQGDPLGPLLFSYGYRGRLDRLAGIFADSKADFSAYLDDTVVWLPHNNQSPLSMREQAQAALNLIVEDFRDNEEDGLSLNVAKCHVHTTAEIRVSGVQLLGTCVGTENFRRTFLTGKVEAMMQEFPSPRAAPPSSLPPSAGVRGSHALAPASLSRLYRPRRAVETGDRSPPRICTDLVRSSGPRRGRARVDLSTDPSWRPRPS